MPKVSIIVNCKDGSKYLDNCLKSIKNQTFTDWELIFINNQSTDHSKEIFEKNKNEKFQYFETKKFETLYSARNLACSKASGEYIAFLDTDDWWYENFLEKREDFFLNNEFLFSYCNCHHFYEKNKRLDNFTEIKLQSGYIYNFLVKNYLVKISCLVVKKDALQKVNYFDDYYNIIGDYDIVMKLSRIGKAHAVQDQLACIRFHGNNFLDRNRKLFFQEYKKWFYNQDFKDSKIARYKFFFFKRLLYLFLISVIPNKIIDLVKKS